MVHFNTLANWITTVILLAPVRANAQGRPQIVTPRYFVTSDEGSALFPISDSTESLAKVVFVRAIDFSLIVVAILAISYIIFSAIQMTTSIGDEAKIEQAKHALIWSTVGLFIVLSTYLIIVATQQAAQGTL